MEPLVSNRHRVRSFGGDRLFYAANYCLIGMATTLVLYPILYVLSSSFSSPKSILAGQVWLLPVEPTIEGYATIFRNADIWRGYANTVLYVVAGTALNVSLTIALAYPLSRKDFRGRLVIMFMVTFTLLFSGGIITRFIIVRALGLYNTRLAMILPTAVSAWYLIITKTYFEAVIPQELFDAARIDGTSNTGFLVRVALPLCAPVIATIGLFYAVRHWNTFFDALIFLRDRRLYPLQIVLRGILLQNQTDEMLADIRSLEHREFMEALLKYSLIVVSTAPVLALYPFVQRHFAKGVMIGSIKG